MSVVVCIGCGARNRVPESGTARCGRCGFPVKTGNDIRRQAEYVAAVKAALQARMGSEK